MPMDIAVLDDIIRRLLMAKGVRTAKKAQVTDAEIRQLCATAKNIFLSQPNLLELEAPIKICGMVAKRFDFVAVLKSVAIFFVESGVTLLLCFAYSVFFSV